MTDDVSSLQQKRDSLRALLTEIAAGTTSSYPLSEGQKALWFLYRSAQYSAAYNIALTVRITSAADVAALQQALRGLVSRHPSLRTTFCERDGKILQEIHGRHDVSLQQFDVPGCSNEELRSRIVEEYRRPFDLMRGPVIRVALFSRSNSEHVLLLTVHHIVCDAWSFWLMADEIQTLYDAAINRTRPNLPPLKASYADFVRWQGELTGSIEGERLKDYWQNQLQEKIPVLALPADRPRPSVRAFQGNSHTFNLPDDLMRQVRALARSEGVTLYVLLLAAFNVLLYRYSGQKRFTIGSPTNGRTRTEFAGVVGYFVNLVVLRADLTGNPRFASFLEAVDNTVRGALAHQDYPFPLLVQRLQVARDNTRTPFTDILFVLQKRQSSLDSPSSALLLDPFEIPQMEGQFDLTLEIEDGGRALLKYDTDLFNRDTIARMAGHYQALLQGISANPNERVSRLPLLSHSERQELVTAWTGTQAQYSFDQCLHERFQAQVERTPDHVALVCEGEQLTYRALNGKANRLAYRLKQSGVGPERLVGVCLERSVEMVVAMLAVLKAGAAYVPLDPSYPSERLAFIAQDARVQVLLTQREFQKALPACPQDCMLLYLEPETLAEDIAGQEEYERNPRSSVSPDNLAYMIYTSGSTGNPKGAMNTHRAISNRLSWMQQEYQLTAADRILQKTPFSFDVSVWEFFWPLITGARLVMARPGGQRDCVYLGETIRSEGITVLHFVPSMLRAFLDEAAIELCSSLKKVFCSGEALTPELQDRCLRSLDVELHNLYGPTEAAVDVTYWRCSSESSYRMVPIGRPIANTQILILDHDLEPVPVGVPGEIHIGGVNLGRGYFNKPDLTAERFIPHPFADHPGARLYKSGDLARFLPDGNIEFLGRRDHQVKIRGFRIELNEIESVLLKHSNIKEAVVVASEGQQGDGTLVAYVVPVKDPGPTVSSLRRFLLTSIPEYMVPSVFVPLRSMPLTASGKVDRRSLPAAPSSRPDLDNEFVPAQSAAEAFVTEVWKTVLQLERVGIHDNFFELGGHSLQVPQILAELQRRTGRRLSIVEAFQHPTIHSLARHLTAADNAVDEHGQDRSEVRTSRRSRVDQLRDLRRNHRAASDL